MRVEFPQTRYSPLLLHDYEPSRSVACIPSDLQKIPVASELLRQVVWRSLVGLESQAVNCLIDKRFQSSSVVLRCFFFFMRGTHCISKWFQYVQYSVIGTQSFVLLNKQPYQLTQKKYRF